MLALVFDGTPALRTDYPRPQAAPGEAVVAVTVAGVCSTDLEILKGYMGFSGVMGHEFVGRVAEGPGAWIGRRVVGEINCPCGTCGLCRDGLGNHCAGRTVVGIAGRDGVFAEHVALPVANLHEVPPAVDDDHAVFVEPLAAAFQVLEQVEVGGRSVAVLGAGRLGQLVARVLAGAAGRLLLVGRHEPKLRLAARQGIETCLARDFQPARQFDVVADATGRADGLALAMEAVRPRGTIVLKSTVAGGGGPNLAPLVINEVTVVGSRCGPFSRALRALQAGQVEVASLITARFPLSEALAACQAARSGENVKVLIDVGS